MTLSPQNRTRLLYIDWMRGLAVVLMIQTHTVDSWLAPALRNGRLFQYSQLLGGFPAPCFMFLAGLVSALGYQKILDAPVSESKRLWLSVRRGLQIFGLALVFQLQEFAQWTSWTGWRSIFTADMLNIIGLSLAAVGIVLFAARRLRTRLIVLAGLCLLTGLATPAVWGWAPLERLPWMIRCYFSGTFALGKFPLFPWFGFAPIGAVMGLMIGRWKNDRQKLAALSGAAIAGGTVIIVLSRLATMYAAHPTNWSFWSNSPEYFFIRAGIQLVVLGGCFFLGRRFDPGRFSWMRLFGRHSLIVYWVHMDLVYGRLFGFLKGTMGPVGAIIGTMVMTGAMLLLAWAMEHWRPVVSRIVQLRKRRSNIEVRDVAN